MSKKTAIITFCLLLVSIGNLFSAHPFLTDDYGTVTKGVVEIELGNDFQPGQKTGSSYLNLKHGLTDRMEIDLTFSYEYPQTSPLNVFFKIHILKGSTVNLSAGISHDLGKDAYDYILILSQQYGNLAVNFNIGGIDNFNAFILGISPVFSLNDRLSAGLDVSSQIKDDIQSLSIGAGITYTLEENLTVSAGGFVDIKNNSELNLSFGLTMDL
ncbi:MAG: hypothetical protein KAS64_06240 [Spirochaetes bacterium]|nr:hypothetical protein [Spirochaetota bacterium]